MLSDYIDIIKIVMLGLDILIALILLRFVLTGLRRGFARNCFRLILIVVLVLIFSVGCKGIIKNVIAMELPINYDVYAEQVSIQSIVETVVVDNLFEGDFISYQESNLTNVVSDVTVSIVSIVVFTVMSILIYILIAPIITLICKIFLPCLRKKRDGVKVKYGLLSKILGLGCALARFAILMMIFFVPLYGLIEVGKVVVEEAALVDEDMNELNVELDEAVGESVMLKITSNIGKNKNGSFGLGAKTLGSRFLISTEYANINIIKELDAVGSYLPRAIELGFKMMDAEDINQIVSPIEEQDIITITNYLADSNIIKVAYPVAMSYLDANEEMLELNVDIDFNELSQIKISDDLKKLQPFFISVLHCVKQIDLNNFDVWEILENKNLITEALDAINIVLNLEITDKLVLKLGTEYLNDFLVENSLAHLVDLINNDYLKNKFITDVKALYDAYLLLDNSGIIDYFMEEQNENFEITEQVTNDLKGVIEIIFNLELIKTQEKKIIQTVFMLTELEPELYEEMFKENIDWSKEVDSVGDILVTLIETVVSIDLSVLESKNTLDYLALLESDDLINGITEILNTALTMQLSEKYVLPLVIDYIEDFLTTCNLEEFKGIVDVEYIEYSFVKDLKQLVEAYKALNETKLLEYFIEENKDFVFDENSKIKLLGAFNKIIELELIEGNEKQLVAYVTSLFGEEVNIDFDQMLEENIDWSLELHTLTEVVVDALDFTITCEFDQENIEELIKNDKFSTIFPSLVEKVFTLQIAEKYIAPIIINTLNDVLAELGFEKFASYVDVEYLKNDLSKDLVSILDMFDIFTELGLEDVLSGNTKIELNENDKEKFRLALSTLLNLHIIDDHESELIIMLCDTCGLGEFISYSEDDFKNVNWDIETDNLIDVFMAILNVSNIDSFDSNYLESENFEETSKQLGDLFDALVKCSITKTFAFDLIDNLIGSIGYEIELNDDDKLDIEVNSGKVEFNALTNVAKDVMDLFSSDKDYSALKGEDITKLMIDASEGVIASKVMGTVLNEILGENGLDIMPVDDITGEKLYDFTNQTTLKEQAVNIGNCIDLVNNLQSFDPDNIDSITDIASSLEALGSLEGEKNIVEDLLTEFLPGESIEITENVNWSEEAGIVEEVLNLYKETENKDEFEITDSELLGKVEDSEFADIILNFLGVFNK